MKIQFLLSTLLILGCFSVQAAPQRDPSEKQLLKAVAKKFLIEANDSKSALGKRVLEINEGMRDGRNQEGGISFPIKAQDIQVVTISREEITNPWHYANKEGSVCSASTDDSSFLILLETHTGEHMTSDTGKILFEVNAHRELRMRILNKSTDFCDPIAEPASKYSPVQEKIVVENFTESQLVTSEAKK